MDNKIDAVFTEHIGAMPMIVDYLKKIQFAQNIDNIVKPLRSNNERLSHGTTCFVFILYLLCRPHVTYKLESWVQETTYLKAIFPDISSKHFTDDRLGDTFKALYRSGIRNLFSSQSINIIKEFNLSLKQIHCDFTSFTVSGCYDEDEEQVGIKVTYGFSKANKPNMKQFMQEVSVVDDGGVPIAAQTLDGNTSDVTRYAPVWKDIKECLGSSDFLVVGDCKLSSHDNLLTIASGSGYFLAPLAMYSPEKKELKKLILVDKRIPLNLLEKKDRDETIVFKGFETQATIVDEKTGKEYPYRKLYIYSSQLEAQRMSTLDRHICDVSDELNEIAKRINHYKIFDTEEKINKKISSILKSQGLEEIINYTLEKDILTEKKKIGRGKVTPNSKYEEVQKTMYKLEYSINKEAKEEYQKVCGYFILATNKSSSALTIKQGLIAYKQEWKVESIFHRLKDHFRSYQYIYNCHSI